MGDNLIRGSEIAAEIRAELKQEIEQLKKKGVIPGLVTILVGEDPASQSYVAAKNRTAIQMGITSKQVTLDQDIDEEYLLELIEQYNNTPEVDGILVQLPLPAQIDETKILNSISPEKDVDGFHPVNVGRMVLGKDGFLPCTPHGILEMLVRSGVKTDGAKVVVIGRSNIVGKPVANLMLQKRYGGNATVTVCHTGTRDLKEQCREADILIAAVGVPKMVTADMVKDGAVVIDVGVNRVGVSETGKVILTGDVDFEQVRNKAAMITPVPGGVGPMTITMLMKNTVQSAEKRVE